MVELLRVRELPLGVVALVRVAAPETVQDARNGERVAERLQASLLPTAEREHAERLPTAQRASFLLGRWAAHAALSAVEGHDVTPGALHALPPGTKAAHAVLPNEYGAPVAPMGIALSISHKEPAAASHHVAVALARTRASGETVGVDVEAQVPISARVAARILTEHERRCIDGEGADAVGLQALAYFSLKEAFYKAVHPWLLRHVGFQEVEVDRGDDASTFRFVAGTPVCDAVGGHYEDGEWLVATALVRTCQAA